MCKETKNGKISCNKKKKNRKNVIKVYSLKVRDGDKKVSISISATPMLVLALFFGISLIIRAKNSKDSHRTAAPFGNVVFGTGNIDAALSING